MIKPGGITDLVGLALFVVILVMQYRRAKETA